MTHFRSHTRSLRKGATWRYLAAQRKMASSSGRAAMVLAKVHTSSKKGAPLALEGKEVKVLALYTDLLAARVDLFSLHLPKRKARSLMNLAVRALGERGG